MTDKPTTEEMLAYCTDIIYDGGYNTQAPMWNAIRARLSEYDTMKAEVQRCYTLLCGARCVYCGEVVSPEAQNQDIADETLRQHVLTCAKHPVHEWKARAEKAEAALEVSEVARGKCLLGFVELERDLEAARPLLEAIENAAWTSNIKKHPGNYMRFPEDDAERILGLAMTWKQRPCAAKEK